MVYMCIGNKNASPAEMAVIMLTAIDQFVADTKPVSLKRIVVCIYQQDMIREFCASIAAVASRSRQQAMGRCLETVFTSPFN